MLQENCGGILSQTKLSAVTKLEMITRDENGPKESFSLKNVSFRGIEIGGLASGLWDMWIETEDNLGNRGLAPYAEAIDTTKGKTPVRQIEKK